MQMQTGLPARYIFCTIIPGFIFIPLIAVVFSAKYQIFYPKLNDDIGLILIFLLFFFCLIVGLIIDTFRHIFEWLIGHLSGALFDIPEGSSVLVSERYALFELFSNTTEGIIINLYLILFIPIYQMNCELLILIAFLLIIIFVFFALFWIRNLPKEFWRNSRNERKQASEKQRRRFICFSLASVFFALIPLFCKIYVSKLITF